MTEEVALGEPVQTCGHPVQRHLPGTDADHHPARLPPHLLQQSGEGWDESEDAAVLDGAQRHRRHAQHLHTSGAGRCCCGDGQDGGGRGGPERAGEAFGGDRPDSINAKNV